MCGIFYLMTNHEEQRKLENDMLQHDDLLFSRTTIYLTPLIESALDKQTDVDVHTKDFLIKQIYDAIPVAAKRFLQNKNTEDKEAIFSVYFTWYISEIINKK